MTMMAMMVYEENCDILNPNQYKKIGIYTNSNLKRDCRVLSSRRTY